MEIAKFYIMNAQGKKESGAFKTKMFKAIQEVSALLPECREKALFLTKMEEGMFFGTKAIASKPENHDQVLTGEY